MTWRLSCVAMSLLLLCVVAMLSGGIVVVVVDAADTTSAVCAERASPPLQRHPLPLTRPASVSDVTAMRVVVDNGMGTVDVVHRNGDDDDDDGGGDDVRVQVWHSADLQWQHVAAATIAVVSDGDGDDGVRTLRVSVSRDAVVAAGAVDDVVVDEHAGDDDDPLARN